MRKSRLLVEELEDRTVPALFGNSWPDAQHLTLSFVPDGTATASAMSSLFGTLDALAPTSTWQREVLRAFQTWAVNANINIGLVSDSGLPLGTTGAPEGDPRFGDIRIAAEPLSPGVLALVSPFDYLAGTRSGDVRLNSLAFSADATPYDVFSVFLHEAGHVFGLDHSDDPASPLYEIYAGVRSGLTPDDIANLQALYGARSADAFDVKRSNDTLPSATALTPSGPSSVMTATADLTTLGDIDWYQFRSGSKPGPVTVQLRTAGVSLLAARVSVYDSAGRLLASTDAGGEPGRDLQLRFDQLPAGSTYFVKVERATNDVFGIGGYRLEVSAGSSPAQVIQQPAPPRPAPDNGATLDAAVPLQQKVYRTDARFDYAYSGNFDPSEVRYFRFKAPTADPGTPTVLTIMTWAMQPSGGQPSLTVYDTAGNPVNADVLVRENGTFVVQVRNVVPNAQ